MTSQQLPRTTSTNAEAQTRPEVAYDKYGFVSAQRFQAKPTFCSQGAIAAWGKYATKLGENKLDRSRGLCLLVRRGVPDSIRGELWQCLSGAHQRSKKFHENYFGQLLSSDAPSPEVEQEIEKDLGRTFPGHRTLGSLQGVASLRRVLVAYARHNPLIGYCQSMNMLVGMLLLFVGDEEAFWLLDALLANIMPAEYYTPTMAAAIADQLVLSEHGALGVAVPVF